MEERKILVIHTGGIGDLIMATPTLKAVRHLFPKASIHFLGNPKSIEAIRDLPYVNEIIAINTGRIKSRILGEIPGMLKLVRFLRNRKYNSLFVLQPQLTFGAAIRMGLFIIPLGIPERFGRNTNGRAFFLTKEVEETSSSKKHEVERMLDVIRLAGAVPENYNMTIPISQNDRNVILGLLNDNRITQLDFLIALAPGFGKPTRGWYPDKWAQLADRLISKHGATILIVGGLKEMNLAIQISNLMKERPIIIAGKTNIFQTAALMEQCQIVISNDSGPMHIAAAVRANIVALFGPGDYNRIRPYANTDKFVIVTKNAQCAPCYKVECKETSKEGHRCMTDITVDDVFLAAEKFILVIH